MTPAATDLYPYTIGYVSQMLGTSEQHVVDVAQKLGIVAQQDKQSGRLFFNPNDVEMIRRMVVAQRSQRSLDAPTQKAVVGASSAQTSMNPVQATQKLQTTDPITPAPGKPASANGAAKVDPTQAPIIPPPGAPQGGVAASATNTAKSSVQPRPAQPVTPGAGQIVAQPGQPIASSSRIQALQAKAQSPNVPTLSKTDISQLVETVSHAKESILKDLSQLIDDKLAGVDELVVELIRSKSENDALREEIRRLEDARLYFEGELSKFRPAAFGFFRKDK